MKLALIDDNTRLCVISKKLLKEAGHTLFFQSKSGLDAIQLIKESNALPDICIIEGDFGAASVLLEKYPNLKVIISSTNDDKESITGMLKIGVCGYVLKYADPDEIVTAVVALSKGKKYFSVGVSDIAREYFQKQLVD